MSKMLESERLKQVCLRAQFKEKLGPGFVEFMQIVRKTDFVKHGNCSYHDAFHYELQPTLVNISTIKFVSNVIEYDFTDNVDNGLRSCYTQDTLRVKSQLCEYYVGIEFLDGKTMQVKAGNEREE